MSLSVIRRDPGSRGSRPTGRDTEKTERGARRLPVADAAPPVGLGGELRGHIAAAHSSETASRLSHECHLHRISVSSGRSPFGGPRGRLAATLVAGGSYDGHCAAA